MSRHPGECVTCPVRSQVWNYLQLQAEQRVHDQVLYQVLDQVNDQAWGYAWDQLEEEFKHDQTSR